MSELGTLALYSLVFSVIFWGTFLSAHVVLRWWDER